MIAVQEHRSIYMDYAATTPVDPRVTETMLEFLGREGRFANASSTAHLMGREARDAVESARAAVAAVLNVAPETVIFTSGATEADNLGIKGAARARAKRGRHIVTEKTAHKAVLDSCKALEREGFDVSYLVPDKHGIISPDSLANALRDDTVLVALLHANNETGVVQDLDALARVVRQSAALFHVDAAQSAGKLPLDLGALDIDLLAFSAHKLCGPKGAGVLYLRKGVRIEPMQHGGGHERGLRAGTLATHQIAGLAHAFTLAVAERDVEMSRLAGLRKRLWQGLAAAQGVFLNGDPVHRLPNILNVSVAGVDGEALQFALRDIACSAGAACNSASREPSYVLRALGRDDRLAGASLRFSLGRWSTEGEVDCVVRRFCHEVARLRTLAGAAA